MIAWGVLNNPENWLPARMPWNGAIGWWWMAGVLVVCALLIVIVLRQMFQLRKLRTICRNNAAMLSMTKLDYFILDEFGNFLVPPRNEDNWPRMDDLPVTPDQWVIPEDQGLFNYQLQRLITGQSRHISFTYRVCEGRKVRYFTFNAFPASAGGSRRTKKRFFGTLHDVTAVREREREYNDTLKMLQTIMDNLPCPIFTKDIADDFRYLTSNRLFAQHVNRRPYEVVGKTDFELMSQQKDAELLRSHDMALIASGKTMIQYRENYRLPDGSEYYCFSLKRILTLSNGKEILLGISIDLTEEERAKNELLQANSIMQAILDNAPCLIWAKDMDDQGKYILSNAVHGRLFQELDANDKTLRDLLPESDIRQGAADDALTLNSPGEVFSFDRVYHLNGRETHLHVSKVLIQAAEGRRLLLGIAVDVSNLMSMQRELEAALEKANAANKAKSYFFASVSHELRTPLNAVIGFSELLQENDQTSEERQENLKAINYAGNMLLELINDILDLSKLDANRMVMLRKPLNLKSLFEKVILSFRPRCVQENIQLDFEVSPMLPGCVLGDALRLKQILFNLLGNAVKYTHEGHISVRLEFLPGESRGAGILRFSVSDTGCGISAADQKRIFEPFSQSSSAIFDSSRSDAGSGLGLPIAKRMVEAMGGILELQSEVGHGSQFTVTLYNISVVPEAELETETKTSTGKMDFSHCRALVVDDVDINLKVMRSMLRNLNVGTVVLCSSGEEALSKVSEVAPDVILTDLWMPGLGGEKLTQLLRENPQTADIPVIAVTADTRSVGANSFDDVLLKPVTRSTLEKVLLKWIGKK